MRDSFDPGRQQDVMFLAQLLHAFLGLDVGNTFGRNDQHGFAVGGVSRTFQLRAPLGMVT